MAKKTPKAAGFVGCTLRQLPSELTILAAKTAIETNPANQPGSLSAPPDVLDAVYVTPSLLRIAVQTTKYWGANGVKLSVGFLDGAPSDLRARILSHMNAWGQNGRSNVVFQLTTAATSADVRITREASGYWSYLGTDIRHIPLGQATMNLQGFTMSTPDREFYRVVRHETGHTLGMPHEHMRRAIIARLDRAKTIAYFRQTQGWSEEEVIRQVLTPLEETSLIATPAADETSIMTYQLPGSITKDGQPIPGGTDANQTDLDFCARIYPGVVAPPPPPGQGGTVLIRVDTAGGTFALNYEGRQVSGRFNADKSISGTWSG